MEQAIKEEWKGSTRDSDRFLLDTNIVIIFLESESCGSSSGAFPGILINLSQHVFFKPTEPVEEERHNGDYDCLLRKPAA
jgi:hypothetical protein